jgi:hypothetical protein
MNTPAALSSCRQSATGGPPRRSSRSFRLAAVCAAAFLALACLLLTARPASAGGNISTQLPTPNGSGATTADGDYISASAANGGMNAPYHYFVEVPAGLSRLVVEMFDADIGLGGAGEAASNRDRARNTFDTAAAYTLIDPTGTARPNFLAFGNATGPAGTDNAWVKMYDILAGGNDHNVLDNFATRAYNNNNGSVNWSTNWTETNDDNSATAGLIQVTTGGQLSISDNAGTTASSIQRSAALTTAGFTNAILSFNFQTSTNTVATDQMAIQVSSNAGVSWTTLETFTGPSTVLQQRAYNITSFINVLGTSIRFIRITGYNGHQFLVDSVQIKNDSLPAGHWEVRIDQSSAVTAGTAINAVGVRANDGTAGGGGTELNVYSDSQLDVGVNPPTTGTTSHAYTFYPYITSGCSGSENDFDFDSDSGTVGSVVMKNRTGTFTQTFASGALSVNDTWKRNTFTGYTTDQLSDGYGVWESDVTIDSYVNGAGQNGNYANVYMANSSAAANPPAANPTANAFRIYFPNDAGTAPAKPYLLQRVTYLAGPNPPVAGSTTRVQVSVEMHNPAAQAITFSAADLVTVDVPGAGAVYVGGATTVVNQGTIVSQPAAGGGTGNITWNPGTLAAGGLAALDYRVDVTPTVATPRVVVTGTVAGGTGTTAKYLDETGDTAQPRATYTFGPICELALQVAVVTPVVVWGVHAEAGQRGGVQLEWDTTSEVGSVGFDIWRWEPREARYVQANARPLPALLQAPQGGHYRFLDATARPDGEMNYIVVENVATAHRVEQRAYGPYTLSLSPLSPLTPLASLAPPAPLSPLADSGFDRTPHPFTAARHVAGNPSLDPADARAALTALDADASATGETAAIPEATGKDVTAGGGTMAIGVGDAGIYFVSSAQIAANVGLPQATVEAMIAANGFALSTGGNEVAWTTAPGSPGIVFYGQPTQSIYTTDNVYWLRPGTGAPMRTLNDTNPAPASSTLSFRDTQHTTQKTFAGTVVATDPNADYWFWDALSAGDPDIGTKTYQAFATGVSAAAQGGSAAHLQANLFGATSTGVADEHHAVILLNGSQIAEDQWSGMGPHTVAADFSPALLQEGANNVTVQAVLNSGVSSSILYLESFDIAYGRSFQAVADSLLLRGDSHPVVTVGGFNGTRIDLLDLGADPRHPSLVNGFTLGASSTPASGPYAVSFTPASPQTPYYAASRIGWKAPRWLRAANPVQLLAQGKGSVYLIVTDHDLLAAAQQLATYRSAQGLRSMVVDIQDVYDQWSNGIPDPNALHDFLAAATANWKPAPRFVVLAGQGSLDYKNYLGFGANVVPALMTGTPYGLFASDNRFVDATGGNGVPQMAIGRLPVATAAELSSVVQKIQSYEAGGAAPWSSRAVLVADAAQGGANFTTDSEQIATALPAGYGAERIYLDQVASGPARSTLLTDLTSGVGLVNYVGHGGLDQLSADGLLGNADVASLANGARLPVVSALSCTINRFELPGLTPLGAALVRQSGGGAVAVWAPSGISASDAAKVLGERFYLELGQAPAKGLRLGEVVDRTLADYAATASAPDLLDIYLLMGDPALVVKGAPVQPAGSGTRRE